MKIVSHKQTRKFGTQFKIAAAVAALVLSQSATTMAQEQSAGSLSEVSQQSTLSLQQVKAPAKRFSGSLVSHNEFMVEKVNTGGEARGNSGSTELWLRLGFEANPNLQLGLGQDFAHNAFKVVSENSTQGFKAATDPFVSIAIPKTAALPQDVVLSSAVRIYAPVTEPSRDQGVFTEIRAYASLSKEIGRLTVSLNTNPRFYVNTKSWYERSSYNASGTTPAATRAFRIINYLEGSYRLTDSLNIAQNFGFDDQYFNSANINGTNVDADTNTYVNAETRLEWSIIPNLSFNAGITTYDRDIRSDSFALYGEDARYFVDAVARF